MKKILVIDDEPDILEVVKHILTRKNFHVETTSNWQMIFDKIHSYHPDLILLDVSLGGADGREICNEIKNSKETENIPIILFSAHYNLVNNLKGCAADDIITKPFDISHLVNTINQNLN